MNEVHIKHHIPTAEYAFTEVEYDVEAITPAQLRDQYQEYEMAFKVGGGLPDDEWNETLDQYRKEKGISEDKMVRLNKAQQWLIKQLDKSNNRLAYKAASLKAKK